MLCNTFPVNPVYVNKLTNIFPTSREKLGFKNIHGNFSKNRQRPKKKKRSRSLISTTKLTVESVIGADWRLEVRFPLTRVTALQSALTPATCETSLPWPSPCFPITKPRSPLLLTNARLWAGRRHRCIANKAVALKKGKVEVGHRAPNTTNPPPTATISQRREQEVPEEDKMSIKGVVREMLEEGMKIRRHCWVESKKAESVRPKGTSVASTTGQDRIGSC